MTKFVNESTVKLYKTNASDLDVARAAWVSQSAEADTKSAEPGRVEGLINFLYKNRHMSPFEHGQFTFYVRTPLFVAREFQRHRTFSFNEISGRYTQMEAEFYIPKADRPLRQTGKVGNYLFATGSYLQRKIVEHGLRLSNSRWAEQYQRRLKAGIAKEVARMDMPLNTMTTFWATVNPRNLMHFLDLRTDPTALYEIREVAGSMEEAFKETMPLTWKAWNNNE